VDSLPYIDSFINIMPLDMCLKLVVDLHPTNLKIQLTNDSLALALGVIEKFTMNVDQLLFLTDFMILNTPRFCCTNPVILGRPFLDTSNDFVKMVNNSMTLYFANLIENDLYLNDPDSANNYLNAPLLISNNNYLLNIKPLFGAIISTS